MNIFKAIRKYFVPLSKRGFWIIFNYPKMKKYGKYPYKFDVNDRYNFQWKIYENITYALNIHVHLEGKENMPKDPVFMVSNHQGFYDPFLAANFKENHFISIAKKEIADFPFVGWVAKSTDTIFLNREDLREALRVNLEAKKYIEEGRSIWMSPEGTRSKNENFEMNEFKPGALKAAFLSKSTIVPMVLDDTWKAFNIEAPGRVDMYCKVLKPIPYDEYKDMTTSELAVFLHDLINNELQEIRKNKK